MAEPLRIGVIGAGGMGTSHARAIRTLTRARVTAVCDADEARGRKLAEDLGVPWFGDYQELLRGGPVDAVTVATPPFTHREVTIAAAQHGKHVFCEKPMAVEVPECEAMIEAAERAKVVLTVGQVLRFLSPFIKVRELVESGAIGRTLSAEITRIGGGAGGTWSVPWRASLAKSGGLLMEINAHEIDLLRCLGGDVASVFAQADNYLHQGADFPDIAFVLLRFRGGAVGCLYSSNASAIGRTSGTIQGEKGTIQYNGWGTRGTLEWKRFGEERPTVIRLEDLQVPAGVAYELDKFAEAALTGTPPVVTGLDGLKAVEIAQAAYASMRTGQPVTLPVR